MLAVVHEFVDLQVTLAYRFVARVYGLVEDQVFPRVVSQHKIRQVETSDVDAFH